MLTSDLKLALVQRGANRFRYRGSSWLVPRGTLILAEPGEVHAVESVDGAFHVLILFIDVEAVAGLKRAEANSLRDGVSFRRPLTRDQASVGAFRALAAALADASAPALLAEERLVSAVDTVSRAYVGRAEPSERSEDARAVRRAREMLHDFYSESVTLDALAAESGLPKARFLRAFKRLVGVPPHAYQVHVRVDHARRMLAAGADIADSAASSGFVDQSHFHRHFKRLQGVTPAQYRRGKPSGVRDR